MRRTGLNPSELQPATKEKVEVQVGTGVSLSDVPARQARSSRSWQAWFKRNYRDEPETICGAVQEGFQKAAEDIRKALAADE